ncbi:MAG: hypothetical protein KDK39_19780, partial [Leptospiraceae bacterium]|nr:hypothetical protein [Leptospiraceae bacterium]
EVDDIDLLNAHRYPDSMTASELAHIRNSPLSQQRLTRLLKEIPSSRRSGRDKDISLFLPDQDAPAESGADADEDYEAEYDESAGTNDTYTYQSPAAKESRSGVGKILGKYFK